MDDDLPKPLLELLMKLNEANQTELVERIRGGADMGALELEGLLKGVPAEVLQEMATLIPHGQRQQSGHDRPPDVPRYDTPLPRDQEDEDSEFGQCTNVDGNGNRCQEKAGGYCPAPGCGKKMCEVCWQMHQCLHREEGDGKTTKKSGLGGGKASATNVSPAKDRVVQRKTSPRPTRVETGGYRTERQAKKDEELATPRGPSRVLSVGEQADPKKQRDQPRPEEFLAHEMDKPRLGPQYVPRSDEKIVCLRGKHCRACERDATQGTKTCKARGPEDACPSCIKKGYCAVAVKVKHGVRIDPCSRDHVVRCPAGDGQEVWRRVMQPEVPLPSTGLTSQEAFDLEDSRFIERKKVNRQVEELKGLNIMAAGQFRAAVKVSVHHDDDTPNDTVDKATEALRFYNGRSRMKGEADDIRKELRGIRDEARHRERKFDLNRKNTVDKLKSQGPPDKQSKTD